MTEREMMSREIGKLREEIKRYRQELKDIRDISTGAVHEFAKNALLAGDPHESS